MATKLCPVWPLALADTLAKKGACTHGVMPAIGQTIKENKMWHLYPPSHISDCKGNHHEEIMSSIAF